MDDIGSAPTIEAEAKSLEVQNDEKRGLPRAPLVVADTSAGPLDAACGMFAIAPLMWRGYNEYLVYFRTAFHRFSHPPRHRKDAEQQHDGRWCRQAGRRAINRPPSLRPPEHDCDECYRDSQLRGPMSSFGRHHGTPPHLVRLEGVALIG
jgi:hypothetical protein